MDNSNQKSKLLKWCALALIASFLVLAPSLIFVEGAPNYLVRALFGIWFALASAIAIVVSIRDKKIPRGSSPQGGFTATEFYKKPFQFTVAIALMVLVVVASILLARHWMLEYINA